MWITNARRRELNSFPPFGGALGAPMSWLSLNDYLVEYLSMEEMLLMMMMMV